MVDAPHQLVAELLANLYTGIVCSLLLVVAGIGTLVEALYEFVDICCVNAKVAHEIVFQSVRLSHTDSVAQ